MKVTPLFRPTFLRGALAFATLCGGAVNAIDLLEAPGPGYREQAGRVMKTGDPLRPQLAPAQLKILRERLGLPPVGAPRKRPPRSENPSSSNSPILPGALPELPRAHPFETPIRLFERVDR